MKWLAEIVIVAFGVLIAWLITRNHPPKGGNRRSDDDEILGVGGAA